MRDTVTIAKELKKLMAELKAGIDERTVESETAEARLAVAMLELKGSQKVMTDILKDTATAEKKLAYAERRIEELKKQEIMLDAVARTKIAWCKQHGILLDSFQEARGDDKTE